MLEKNADGKPISTPLRSFLQYVSVMLFSEYYLNDATIQRQDGYYVSADLFTVNIYTLFIRAFGAFKLYNITASAVIFLNLPGIPFVRSRIFDPDSVVIR